MSNRKIWRANIRSLKTLVYDLAGQNPIVTVQSTTTPNGTLISVFVSLEGNMYETAKFNMGVFEHTSDIKDFGLFIKKSLDQAKIPFNF